MFLFYEQLRRQTRVGQETRSNHQPYLTPRPYPQIQIQVFDHENKMINSYVHNPPTPTPTPSNQSMPRHVLTVK